MTIQSDIDEASAVTPIVEQIKPLLAHKPPGVQGAVLADLLAIWLAGHMAGGSEMQEKLLAMHNEMVRALIPVNEAMIRAKAMIRATFGEGPKQ